MLKRGPIASITLVLALLLATFATTAQAAKRPLIFGVHPYLHPSVLIQRFQPLVDYLQQGLQQPIQIRVGTSYEDHIQAFTRGEIDFG